MSDPLVEIGRIVKPHGIRGEVVVEVRTDLPDRFAPGATVVVGDTSRSVATARPHQGRLLVRFAGVEDRTAAERLRGQLIRAEPRDVSDHESYFVHELVGMTVRDVHGKVLGRVSALVELPDAAGYDLLEVRRDDGSTWLLPAVDDYVEVVEAADGGEELVLIDPPAGLVGDVEE